MTVEKRERNGAVFIDKTAQSSGRAEVLNFHASEMKLMRIISWRELDFALGCGVRRLRI